MPDNQTIKIHFSHRQSAHCESGVTANLLGYYGIEMSESLAFGIGAGLFFAYFPFIKLNGLPLITFRGVPGKILKRVTKGLGVALKKEVFRDQERAMDALDKLLEKGIPVGVQTGVYWLPYFPPALRFHFNAHNLVVFGKNGNDYLISDPVFEKPVICPREDLKRARFAQGALAPKGRLYYVTKTPDRGIDFRQAVQKGIKSVCRVMLKTPFPLIGIKGMRLLANRMEKWPENLGDRRAALHLGHFIRMQEEIGTGGAGFRFIYGAFLQEAADILEDGRLLELSREMTDVGDLWREFAKKGARLCKGRPDEGDSYSSLADIVRRCAAREEGLLKRLLSTIR